MEGVPPDRLADQQVHVIGHDHETHQRETIALAHLRQNSNEGVLGSNGTEQGKPPITTEGGEMKMPVAIVANGVLNHKR